MAIEYTLLLTRDAPAEVGSSEHVQVHIGPVGEPSATFYAEDFGIRPRQSVLFRLDKFELEGAQDELASLVGVVLRASADDVLLLQNGETPVLRRDGPTVAVSQTSAFASVERRNLLDLPTDLVDLGGPR